MTVNYATKKRAVSPRMNYEKQIEEENRRQWEYTHKVILVDVETVFND